MKICSKFTEDPCRDAISIKLQSNFIEITLRHGCSPVNLQHIFRTPFPKNTFGRLLLNNVGPFETSFSELFQAFESTRHYRDQCMILPEGTNSMICAAFFVK